MGYRYSMSPKMVMMVMKYLEGWNGECEGGGSGCCGGGGRDSGDGDRDGVEWGLVGSIVVTMYLYYGSTVVECLKC